MSEVTRILSAIEQGDPHAGEQLLPLVYDELRRLAAQKLAREKPGQTFQATALVHEAYVRLVDMDNVQHWNSRGHFFAAAAEAMRRILVEQARRKSRRLSFCVRRGGCRMATDDPKALHCGFEIRSSIPVLRMLDEAKAKAFYLDYLGFEVDWEGRFNPTAPLYMQIHLGEAVIHLNGHAREDAPTSQVNIPVVGLDKYCQYLIAKGAGYPKPCVVDPRSTSASAPAGWPFGSPLNQPPGRRLGHARNSPTKSGKWTLPTKSLCGTASRSVGYASRMNAAAPSWRRRFSPLAYWNAVPAGQVQAVLRQVFRRWGRPQRLRLDNGIPWGSMVDLPTELTLWLLGLDIGITFNPPRRPQDNGVIERAQGTGKRWAEHGRGQAINPPLPHGQEQECGGEDRVRRG
jgi:RNA polymerase sigma factor (TIGR02999 family)